MLTETEQFFRIFADANRLRILCLLRRRKMCVCEIAYVLQVTQPSVSRHLKMMKKAGLIGDEQDGLWTNYFFENDTRLGADITRRLDVLTRSDKTIRADMARLKTADREALCCR